MHEVGDSERLLLITENPGLLPGLIKPVSVPYFACMVCGLETRKFATFSYKTVGQIETVVWHNSSKVRFVADHASKCGGKVDVGLMRDSHENSQATPPSFLSLLTMATQKTDVEMKTEKPTG